jgi:lipopolysaccharide export system protein LptA
MRRRKSSSPGPRRLLLSGLLLLCMVGPLTGSEKINYSGDSCSLSLSEGNKRALLTGHAWVQSKDMRITADRIDLFGTDFVYAQCYGNVHVVDAKRGIDLTSQKLYYDRDLKIARVQGNAVMADLENEMTARAGYIEDRDTEKITIMQVGVRIFKKDIVCRAEFARYQRDKKILELSGMPWVSKGTDVYEGTRITINLDTEEITAEGSIKGSFEDKGSSGTSDTGQQSGDGNGASDTSNTGTPGATPPGDAVVPGSANGAKDGSNGG